jgi:RNA recognition motif-containing protein
MFRYAGEERRTRQLPHNLVRNEAMIRNAVRVRGLPFEMKEVEIVDLFSYFSPLPSSLKIGRRYGQKTGQAALLFTSQDLAERALEMNGYQIYGRFLEVMLISSQSYSQFT